MHVDVARLRSPAAVDYVIDRNMSQEVPQDREREALAKRRVPCMIAYIHPFRILNGPESKPFDVTVDEVNRHAWDYASLHELVGGVDVGLSAPYHLVLSRDGAVALPPLPHLRNDQEAVEFFNKCFAALLLGGVYCEAIGLDGLDLGSIIDWQYVRVQTNSPAAPNRFHQLLRLQQASAFEAISLTCPRTSSVDDVRSAIATGRLILDAIPELSGEFLLKGVTGVARRDWGVALTNLWIVTEQITSRLWKLHVIDPTQDKNPIPGRVDQLYDTRTWTIAARHELLQQIDVLPSSTFEKLSIARKARNALAHNGKHPTEMSANAAYDAVADLLNISVPGHTIPLLSLNVADHGLSDPFAPCEPMKLKPTHWMEIPKLPGEAELERLEAQQHARHQDFDKPS